MAWLRYICFEDRPMQVSYVAIVDLQQKTCHMEQVLSINNDSLQAVQAAV